MVSVLISAGAVVTIANGAGETLKDVVGQRWSRWSGNDAVVSGNTAVESSVIMRMLCESLLANEKANRLLLAAIFRGSDEGIVEALEYGADVNVVFADGDTPLHKAVRSGSYVIVRSLISKGASLSVGNNEGDTALMLAQRLRNRRLVTLLGGEHAWQLVKDEEIARRHGQPQQDGNISEDSHPESEGAASSGAASRTSKHSDGAAPDKGSSENGSGAGGANRTKSIRQAKASAKAIGRRIS